MTLRHAQDGLSSSPLDGARDAVEVEPGRRVKLRIGTRGSQLALFQANAVSALLGASADTECEIVVIKTSGDRLADATIAQIGGKRLFVKEIEDALLAGEIDLAVHSSKDLPVVLPQGLAIGAALPREDPRDAIVLPADGAGVPASAYLESEEASARPRQGAPTARDGGRSRADPDMRVTFETLVSRLGKSPRIGTSSVRRTAQLARLVPGAQFLPIRGNLDTRLRKLDEGEYDALVLASAGLIRLGHRARISAGLPTAACVPAPGQGIIAVEARAADGRMMSRVAAIDDQRSRAALDAERTVVARLGGGCQMPIGVYADISGETITLAAIVLSLDGTEVLRAESRGPMNAASAVGNAVAEDLLAQGAAAILASIERTHAAVEGLQP